MCRPPYAGWPGPSTEFCVLGAARHHARIRWALCAAAGVGTTMQWYLAAYALAFAITLVVSARVGDMVGRKTMFCLGMAGFTVASILCGVSG